MPFYHRVSSCGELQFITTRTYRCTPLFLSDRFRRCFVQSLEEVRQELHFLLIGWVLMPEHFHVLIKPDPAETTPLIMKGLKEESAKRIIRTLRENLRYPCSPGCGCPPRFTMNHPTVSGSAAFTLDFFC
jgi:REP element-mobilizing transposase RayT